MPTNSGRISGPVRVALVLLGSATLLVTGTALGVRQVERDLTDRATTRLDEAGIALQVRYDGRDAELTGTPVDADQGREAVDLIAAVHGTRQVRTSWSSSSDDAAPDTSATSDVEPSTPSPSTPAEPDPQADDTSPTLPAGQLTFDSGQTELDAEDTAYLDQVVTFLRNNPTVRMQVRGHADDTGSNEVNLTLSWDRAREVVLYLVGHGVESNRLSAEGLGAADPVVSNDTPEGRAANRRVELAIEEPS